MPSAVHHVQMLTRNRDVIVRYLEESLGLARQVDMDLPLADIADLMGFEAADGIVRSTLLGSGNHGLVEVIECPQAVQDDGGRHNLIGTAQLAFAVEEIERCLLDARHLGATHVVGPKLMATASHKFAICTFELGGVRFQLSSQTSRCSNGAQLAAVGNGRAGEEAEQ